MLIERILLLVRNVLHIPADLDQEKVRKGLGLSEFLCLVELSCPFLFCFVCSFVFLTPDKSRGEPWPKNELENLKAGP